jgi:LEA14-like dessication related protein
MPRFAFTLAIVLLAAFVGGCETLGGALALAPKPDARIIGAEVRNLSLKSLDLVFDIEITNPYGVNLPLLDLNYAVGSGTQQLLQGGIKVSATVPANGSSVIQVPARLDFAAVIQTLTNVKPGSVLPYHAEINVSVDAPLIGAINLPLKHEGEIPIPTIPEISIVSFEFGEMTWEKVEATARLRVKNTNQFQLDLTRLEFNLALGEEPLASAGLRNTSRLAPGQAAIVEIPLAFSPRAFSIGMTGIFDMLRGSEADYSISGRLDFGTQYGPLSIPFSQRSETAMQR